MPNVAECLQQARWLVEKGLANEPAKLVLPRREAAKRRANKEKRTRVQFDCDEQLYRDFHAQLQRYRDLCGNIAVAHGLMVDILARVSDELITQIAESSGAPSGKKGSGHTHSVSAAGALEVT